MANQPPPAITISYPTPPPFYQDFTPEKIEQIERLRSKQPGANLTTGFDPAASLPASIPDLPNDLRSLQPPVPPTDLYRCFGIDHTTKEKDLVSLEATGITQLYNLPPSPTTDAPLNQKSNHNDRAFILKRLAKSLILNFLELLGILSVEPSQYHEKIEDIKTLAINFHHLLNEYRPHQARESLILMMQDQLARKRAETERILAVKKEVEVIIEGLGSAGFMDPTIEPGTKEKAQVDEQNVWEEAWSAFG